MEQPKIVNGMMDILNLGLMINKKHPLSNYKVMGTLIYKKLSGGNIMIFATFQSLDYLTWKNKRFSKLKELLGVSQDANLYWCISANNIYQAIINTYTTVANQPSLFVMFETDKFYKLDAIKWNYYVETHDAKDGVPTGMLMYPSLMSADILLYDADLVPVGADQMSHIDLCRDMAEKFNKRFPGTFKLPSGVLSKTTSKIMSLSNPTRKMSKSESDKGTIYLLDPIEISKKKIMKALTDSENKFYYDPENKPGLSNLINIYAALADITVDDVVNLFKDAENYGVFKRALCELLEAELVPLQQKVAKIQSTGTYKEVLFEGAMFATEITRKKMIDVYTKIGLM